MIHTSCNRQINGLKLRNSRFPVGYFKESAIRGEYKCYISRINPMITRTQNWGFIGIIKNLHAKAKSVFQDALCIRIHQFLLILNTVPDFFYQTLNLSLCLRKYKRSHTNCLYSQFPLCVKMWELYKKIQ